jgi:hypothetical protein
VWCSFDFGLQKRFCLRERNTYLFYCAVVSLFEVIGFVLHGIGDERS